MVNGESKTLDTAPMLHKGCTMVPLRFIAESLGADVKWNPAEQKIMVAGGESGPAEKTQFDVILKIGQNQALVNGALKALDAPPMLYKGCTMVPLRFIAESLGADVKYDPAEQCITIALATAPPITPPPTDGKIGKICAFKFNDINGNGVQDTGEPGLPGWIIVIKNYSGNVVATGTTDSGGLCCLNVSPGTYTVSEVLQPGWSQTYPGNPGTHTVAVKPEQEIKVVFGNQEKPCCLTFQFTAGRQDKFVPDDAEPACRCCPSLVQWCYNDWNQYHPGQPFPGFSDFDATQNNLWFTHCFILPAGNCIQSAKLTFAAKPLSSGAANDTVTLLSGSDQWQHYLGSGNGTPGLLSNPWDSYPLQTFHLDLANLPGGVNLLPSLCSQRNLGVVMQDDTSIDYLLLEVTFCDCSGLFGVHKINNK
ncbi:MAG: stalk domain-containing protein [Bacillota bacterium]